MNPLPLIILLSIGLAIEFFFAWLHANTKIMNKYAAFFAAFNDSQKQGNPHTREEQIQLFTQGRTASLKDLSDFELGELIRSLRAIAPPPPAPNDRADRMRKSIIAIFKSMGRQTKDAIAWAEKQGVRGNKKAFNEYSNGELYVLIGIAEKVKTDWSRAIRTQVTARTTA